MEIRASIHLARGFDNAFWDSYKECMIFGDGGRFDGRGWLMTSEEELNDPQNFKERGFGYLSKWLDNYDLDTIGHELTHGVVKYTAGLGDKQGSSEQWAAYSEAGTLNEHIADCFGIMLKHFVNKHTAETGNWDISPGQWSDIAMKYNNWTANYCRTFKIPEDKSTSPDPNPKHWNEREKFVTKRGYGLDPHINCGIASHAFYLAALKFTGYTWQTVGKIWYDALIDKEFTLPENQTFQGWRNLTVRYAEQHFGSSGKTTVEDAWAQVGL
ncbi:Translation initiation factor 3 subunit b [Mycoblastus sanguinarius]|nr:Translation initiation factor 3 subunit b [Mycoblastus sanguinarius]